MNERMFLHWLRCRKCHKGYHVGCMYFLALSAANASTFPPKYTKHPEWVTQRIKEVVERYNQRGNK